MTDWSKPAWSREPHLLVGVLALSISTLDVSGSFTLAALHDQVTGKVGTRAIGTGYRDHETVDCLDFLVAAGYLTAVTSEVDGTPTFFTPGPIYPTRPDRCDD